MKKETKYEGYHQKPVIRLIRANVFFTIFKNSLKIEFLIFLSVLCSEWYLKHSSFDEERSKKCYGFISQYRCVEINLYLMQFNIEIYQKMSFY